MSFDHRLEGVAEIKPGIPTEAVVEALSPLLVEFGRTLVADGLIEDRALDALRADGVFKFYADDDGLIRFDPDTRELEISTYGDVSDGFYDAVAQVTDRLGPISAKAGALWLSNHDTPDLDDARKEYVFGSSSAEVARYRFEEILSEMHGALSPFLNQSVVDALIAQARSARDQDGSQALSDPGTRVILPLDVLDDEGNTVDTTSTTLTLEQVAGIVDHASEIILVRRERGDEAAFGVAADRLEEALVGSGVLEEDSQRPR